MSSPSFAHETGNNGTPRPKHKPGTLSPGEEFWRDHVPWLKDKGYQLRPRYQPGWVSSWSGEYGDWPWKHEDEKPGPRPNVVDAVRILDGEMVVFKRISRKVHPYEVDISTFFSSEPLRSDPANHCVPIFEVLDVPDEKDTSLLVFPLLRTFDDPRFETVGEAMEFFRQILEGLQFVHRHHVAHRDCMGLNIMMDPRPMYPKMYHPVATTYTRDYKKQAKFYSRTTRPVRYYLIDFGLSRKYAEDEPSPREWPVWGGDKTVPEFQHSDDLCDPFPTDVYYLGSMIRQHFLTVTDDLQFMEPLVDDMVQADPVKRPTIHEVVTRFDELCRFLRSTALRRRLVYAQHPPGLFSGISHVIHATFHILSRHRALPRLPVAPMHSFTA